MLNYVIRSEDKLAKSDYQSIASLLLDKLKECYDRPILIDSASGREWTGDAFYESALNLSHYLIKECHLSPSSVVCFLCSDSDIHAIASVAVLSAAAVYCSLPSNASYREIESALTRIEPEFVVTDQHNYGIAATLAAELDSIKKVMLIDETSLTSINSNLDIIENILQFERSFFPLPVECFFDDTCALTVTSGADGSPNAAIRTNRNLLATATALKTPEVNADDIVLITGLHSHSGLAMFLHSINTMSTVVVADRIETIGDKIWPVIDRYGITCALINDSQLYHFIDDNVEVPSLKTIWFTGSTVPISMSSKARSIKNFRKVYITPEAGWVTTWVRREDSTHDQNSVGKPVTGVEIKIMDTSGHSVPFNTEGEIYVRSAQCSKGYVNNDIESERLLTTDRFVRTGEYGLYDREGLLHIRGHSEEFVKVNDFMISCEELESLLKTRIDVTESTVICGEDRNGRKTIKALVTLNCDHNLNKDCDESVEEDIRRFVNLRVEPRKWIEKGGIEILEELPSTGCEANTFRFDLTRQEQFV